MPDCHIIKFEKHFGDRALGSNLGKQKRAHRQSGYHQLDPTFLQLFHPSKWRRQRCRARLPPLRRRCRGLHRPGGNLAGADVTGQLQV